MPTTPPGSDAVVTTGMPCATTMASDFASLSKKFESVTITSKFDVPTAVGVPEMRPVDAANVNPAGSDPDVTCQSV